MAKKADKTETPPETSTPFPGVNDDQAEVLIRHAAEMRRLEIKHSNERLVMLQRHKTERDAAKINIMSANGPVGAPSAG